MDAPWELSEEDLAEMIAAFKDLSDNEQAYILDMLREGQDRKRIGHARQNYTFFYIVGAQALESELWRKQRKLTLDVDPPSRDWDLPDDVRALQREQWRQPRNLIVDVDPPRPGWDLREDTWALRVRTFALRCVCT
jgi:hypothetical protein